MNKQIQRISWNNQADQARLVECLKNNLVAAGTSDTVMGLLANSTAEGFEALNRAKDRIEKSYIVLIADKTKLTHFVLLPLPAYKK